MCFVARGGLEPPTSRVWALRATNCSIARCLLSLLQLCKYMEKILKFQIFAKLFFVEREVGFKPTTFRLEIWHSNQLNYSRKWSGKRDSDARPQPWQGCTLTNWATSAYHPIYKYIDVFFFTLQIYGKVSLIPNFQRIFFIFILFL